LKPEPALFVIACFLTIALAKLILNNVGYWPFTWRLPEDNARSFAATLITVGRWNALILWIVFFCLVVPCFEEIIFRYAVLQALVRRTTTPMGVLLSSLLFGAAHLGFVPPSRWQVADVFWLSSFGLLLALITVRRSGNIALAIVAHVALNTSTAVVLLLTIT